MAKRKRVSVGTSILPEHKAMLDKLAADTNEYANRILEEGIEMYAKKHRDKSQAWDNFKQKK